LWAGFGTPDGELSFRGSGWGVGGYAGANWTIAKGQRLAVEGTLVSSLKTDVTFPASIAVGYGIDFIGRLTPGFDFQWSKKSSHEDIPTNVDKCQVLLADNHVALIGWKSSIDLGEGITYTLGKHWNLRCGYLFSQNSQAAAPPPRWPSTIALFSAWALAGEASARASICPTHFYTTPPARSAETPRRSSTGVTSTSGNSFSSVSRIVSNHQIAHS
jgi:hypothetical protein